MPIVVGIVALILLALLGWGIWLIVQAQDRNTPAPAADDADCADGEHRAEHRADHRRAHHDAADNRTDGH
jgi:ABC-type nickel/cobalt efflux system permease component RcnA